MPDPLRNLEMIKRIISVEISANIDDKANKARNERRKQTRSACER